MSQLRTLLPLPVAQPVDGVLSPASNGPRSLRPAGSAEFVGKSPRTSRRTHQRMRPVRVMETSVGDLPVLTLQDPSAAQGAMVFDCRPPLLPVSLDLSGVGLSSGLPPAGSAGVEVPPSEHGLSFSGGDSDGLIIPIIPEFEVAPLEDSGTDLEDELPAPDGSSSTDATKPVLGPTSRRVASGWFCGVCGEVAQDVPTYSSMDATSACDGDIRWGPSGPHASGSFGFPGGDGIGLSASIATSVSGSEWGWPVVGSVSGRVGRCGSASQRTWPIVQWWGLGWIDYSDYSGV